MNCIILIAIFFQINGKLSLYADNIKHTIFTSYKSNNLRILNLEKMEMYGHIISYNLIICFSLIFNGNISFLYTLPHTLISM